MREPTQSPEMTGLLRIRRASAGSDAQHYQSYLLRLWRESPDGRWRASIENVATGEKHGFAQLDQLVAYLESPPAADPLEAAAGVQAE